MAEADTQLQWSDEQWNRVRQVVFEEARAARVAGNFLPLYGPLDPDARYVAQETLEKAESGGALKVDDIETLKLATLQVKVYLKGAQVADPELASALLAFRRAANVVARLEDAIVFRGQPKQGEPVDGLAPGPWELHGGQAMRGLLDPKQKAPKVADGNDLVTAVSKAIGNLEKDYHLGPFACVLGQGCFNMAQTPNKDSLVLPQDRILPFLGGGSLLRSSTLPDNSGLVVALGGAPVDLVVGKDISVKFLQVTTDPWYVFRVHEKVVLRIKEPEAIQVL